MFLIVSTFLFFLVVFCMCQRRYFPCFILVAFVKKHFGETKVRQQSVEVSYKVIGASPNMKPGVYFTFDAGISRPWMILHPRLSELTIRLVLHPN